MTRIRSVQRSAVAAAALVALIGCTDRSTLPAVTEGSRIANATAFGALQDIPAVTMDMPRVPRPWDSNDAALVSVLEQEDGHAIIAFKVPTSARASERSGRRAVLPAQAFEEGLRFLDQRGAQILYVYRSFGAAWVKVPPALGPELRRNPLVDYLEPRRWGKVMGVPADRSAITRMLAAPPGQTTPWGISLIQAPGAWSYTMGAGVKVLIIDTGINSHEDLPSVPPGNCGGGYGGCDDGPRFHGTHVSGTFLGRNNSFGVVGVAPGVEGSQVYAWGACDSSTGRCSSTQAAAGIDWGRSQGVKVINMSFGLEQELGVSNAVAQAWLTGAMVLVASAGNLQSVNNPYYAYPAGYTNVIGVSGVRPDKSFAATSPCPDEWRGSWRSNWGDHVDLSAPFWALSTVGTTSYEGENQGWCGTSMAAPHVSGTAALVWARNPSWTNSMVVNHLFTTAEDRGDFGRDQFYGFGVVNALAAVSNPPPPSPTPQITWGPNEVRPQAACAWEGAASGGTPPYTFEWYVSGSYMGSGTYFEYANSGSAFTLQLSVRDAANGYGSTSRTVTVSPSAEVCVF